LVLDGELVPFDNGVPTSARDDRHSMTPKRLTTATALYQAV
jgi:hypothetical protein